jgi:HEAT repeat protein
VLASDRVRAAVPGMSGETWLATDGGLVVMDTNFRVTRVLSKGNGLPANRITSAAVADGILYVAADSSKEGGLVTFDPKTRIFNLYDDADGLPSRRVERVGASPLGRVKIETGINNRIRDSQFVRYPPVFFDPKQKRFSPAGPPVVIDRNNLQPPSVLGEMPWLGGPIVADASVYGHRVLCGTRGVVVLKGTAAPDAFGAFAVNETGTLLDEAVAAKIPYPPFTREGLAPLLRNPNPFVRLKALALIKQMQRGDPAWTAILAATPNDSFLPVRRLAVRVIANAGLPEWNDFLNRGLSDPDYQVRDSSAYGLAVLGEPAAMSYYESILRRDRNYGSTMEPLPPVYEALANQPTPEVISLMLRYPVLVDDYEGRRSLINRIGSSVVRYPPSIELLLRARNRGEAHWSRPTFAQAVLGGAGMAIEARLLDALRGDDRVARSNAARALALMGDRPAIPALLAALDMESGLSRVSIIWALGKLHATEAATALASLYISITPRSASLRGNVYLAQAGERIRWEYEGIESVDALKASWDELATGKEPVVSDFSSGDDTLTSEQILAALAEIGPSASRDFYRNLAASNDSFARREAAIRLADAGASSADVLRGLLRDQDPKVSAAAAVSLFLTDDPAGQAQMLRWMDDCNASFFQELQRVADAKRLAFLKPATASCETKAALGFSQKYVADRILERGRP